MSNYLHCQESNSKILSENDSLYIKAIEDYIVEHEKNPNKYIPKNKQQKVLYIEGLDCVFDLPKSIMGYELVFVWPTNQVECFKKNDGHLLVLEICPLSIENKRFDIGINEFYAKMIKRKKKYLRIGMATRAYFNYVNGKLIHFKTEFGGVY